MQRDKGRDPDGCGLCLSAEAFVSAVSEWRLRVGCGGSWLLNRQGDLEDVFLFVFRAHGEKSRSDDHSEKNQCKN